MSEFGQHVDLVTELFEQLIVNFRVEVLLDCYFKTFVHSFMNCTETSLRYLFANFEILEVNFQNRVIIELKRLFP